MFDAPFYSAVLPDMVLSACSRRRDCSPVVLLHLADGSVLELCDVTNVNTGWIGVAYHKDGTCTGGEFAFVPHALVARVTVSLQRPSTKEALGFRHTTTAQPASPD